MKDYKKWLIFIFITSLTTISLSAQKQTVFLESFEFQGQTYSLYANFSPPRAGLSLKGKTGRNLSADLAGESILLGTRIGKENFYVFWIYYREEALYLAFYDHQLDRSRVLPLTGFRFFAMPEIVEENGGLRALVFLGNQTGNDDVYYYDLEAEVLTPLTRTPFSEKNFSLQQTDSQIEIETRSLWAKYRYRFDPRLRQNALLEEIPFLCRQKMESAALTPEYCNTYIGFGDSITWGQIEGVQRLDLCYLTKMGEMLAEPYGLSWPINLGVPGEQTYDGAERVNQDLDQNPAFYFLLMMGVNDVWGKEFSLESSLENLEFIIDAAQARHMRVIASTLTPRKDTFSLYQYYWDHLRSLSAGIIELANKKGTAYIDTLNAFMNTDPPNGWKDLLESVNPPTAKGNHPNEKGHLLIASLFAPALVGFPPIAPQNLNVLNPQDHVDRKVFWDANFESDFSHFQIEFGFLPEALDYSLTTAASHYTFTLFPFLPHLYFRLRTVDRGNNASEYTSLDAAQTTSTPPAKKIK